MATKKMPMGMKGSKSAPSKKSSKSMKNVTIPRSMKMAGKDTCKCGGNG